MKRGTAKSVFMIIKETFIQQITQGNVAIVIGFKWRSSNEQSAH